MMTDFDIQHARNVADEKCSIDGLSLIQHIRDQAVQLHAACDEIERLRKVFRREHDHIEIRVSSGDHHYAYRISHDETGRLTDSVHFFGNVVTHALREIKVYKDKP